MPALVRIVSLILSLVVLAAVVWVWRVREAPTRVLGSPADTSARHEVAPADLAEVDSVTSLPGETRESAPVAATTGERETSEAPPSWASDSHVTGRVVEHGGGRPVRGAYVRVDVGHGRDPSADRRTTTRADGRFAIDVSSSEVRRFSLHVHGPGRRGPRTLKFTRADLGGDLHVGDVELAPSEGLNLLVVDEWGEPLRGACVKPGAEPGPSGDRTDADGRCTLWVPPQECAAVRVAARGFSTRVAPIPRPLPGEIRVQLSGEAGLTIRVESSAAGATRELYVALSSEGPLFPATGSWTPDPLRRSVQSRWSSATNHGPWGHCAFRLGSGLVRVGNLATGEPLTLRILDDLGTVVLEDTIAPLQATEQREHTVHLHSVGRAFHGVVLGERGLPLEDVEVQIDVPTGGGVGQSTEEDGSFRFENLHTQSFDLSLACEGHATIGWRDYRPPADGSAAEFRLEPGRTVLVVVRDELGTPIPGFCGLEAETDGVPYTWYGEREDPGLYRLTDLPPAELALLLECAGRTWELTVGSEAAAAVFELPVPGSLGVEWALPPERVRDCRVRLVLRPEDPDQEPVVRWITGRPQGSRDYTVVHAGAYEVLVERVVEVPLPEGGETSAAELLVPPCSVTVASGARSHLRILGY